MRVFVSEYLTTSGWPTPPPELVDSLPSEKAVTEWSRFVMSHQAEYWLVNEGMAMLSSFVADLLLIPDLKVHVTRDSALPDELWGLAWRLASARQGGSVMPIEDIVAASRERNIQFDPRLVWHLTTPKQTERVLFEQLAAECDAALIIAPEFRGLLTERCGWVEQVNTRLLGPSSAAVEICSDKLALCERLQAAGVPTIDTFEFDIEQPAAELPFPVVIKPRDGAGSQATYVLLHRVHLAWQLPMLRKESLLRNAVWQPFVAGRALSVGVLISTETGRAAEALPVCDQILSGDGRLKYFGGRVPADCARAAEVQQIALAACEQVAGLRGYVGMDMLLPDDPQSPPLVVEINPRLTTSYLGYQSLCLDNLAERILFPDRDWPPLRWRDRQVAFAPHGFAVPNMD